MDNEKTDIGYFELFFEFFKIGLLTIGGGLVMISIIRQMAVDKKKWLSDEEMMECIAISQSVSGVIAINLATFVGYKLKGKKGSVIATLGVILPAFIVIVLLYDVIEAISKNHLAIAVVKGMKAGIIGVLLSVVWSLGKKTLNKPFHYVAFVMTFVFTTILGWSAILTMLSWGFLAMAYFYVESLIKRRRGDV